MPKISDKTRNKLAGEVIGLLSDHYPVPLSTRAVADELIRDKEFTLKILKFCQEKGYVKKAGQVIATFFGSAESAVEDELGVEGLKIVTDAVTAAEQAGGTGLQKLAAAKASIASNLSTANIINVAQNTINVAIEAAVAQMNAAQAQGGTSAITGIGSAS